MIDDKDQQQDAERHQKRTCQINKTTADNAEKQPTFPIDLMFHTRAKLIIFIEFRGTIFFKIANFAGTSTITIMQNSKYLVANNKDLKWGLTVSTIGYDEIAPNEPYPTRGHAEGYFFNTAKGRILNEYQMLYLVEGEGVFESAHTPKTRIKPGTVFFLFPNEWHTYYPATGKAWKSYWIGFKGKNMDDRVRAGFLSVEKPTYYVGFSADIVRLYETAKQTADQETAYSQQMLAGIVNHLIGLVYSLERNIILRKDTNKIDNVDRARLIIRQELECDITFQDIAQRLGMSYSNLRRQFKEYTGISPALYQQDLRLQRAKEMLTSTKLSVKEIAYRLHFESADYFSTKFKNKVGYTPREFRNLTE